MKYLFFGIIIFICSNLFANDSIKYYMEINNMNYPYNFQLNINDSRFIDYTIEGIGDFVDEYELTNEQKNIMLPFFELLNSVLIPEYFFELKNQPNVIAFSIDRVYLVKYSSEEIYIHVYINFYADKNPGEFRRYNNFWKYFNIAIYSIYNYNLIGFHFE
jgi:hypothetical protein